MVERIRGEIVGPGYLLPVAVEGSPISSRKDASLTCRKMNIG